MLASQRRNHQQQNVRFGLIALSQDARSLVHYIIFERKQPLHKENINA